MKHGLPRFFDDPAQSGPDGLVNVGGDLSPELLLDAYRHGIFPWPNDEDDPMLWWSPDPRAVLPLDGVCVSSRLRRTLRSGRYRVTSDTDFTRVMCCCSSGPGREGGTWITEEMIEGYTRLHRLGFAHSVEVRLGDRLVGGVYGVSLGGLFAAESMFYRERDASKVALCHLVSHLNARGYRLLDIQQWTPHTGRMGAVEISRDEYLGRLPEVVELPITFGRKLESGGF